MTVRLSAVTAAALLTLTAMAPNALAASSSCEPKDLAALSSWGGVWITEGAETGINGRDEPNAPPATVLLKLAGFTAPWNDEGWSRFETTLGLAANRSKQAGWGFPMMMDSYSPFTFVIAPGETVITSQYREIRYVYTDGRGHPAAKDRWPTTWGDSTGCWQGDTLVVETVDVKYDPAFNPFAPPLSEQARYVERLRLVSPGRLESDITITDPVTLEKPWTVKVVYVRAKGLDRLIHEGDIFDNDRTAAVGDTDTIAPPRTPVSRAPPSGPAEVALTQSELDRIAGDYALNGPPLVLKAERRGRKLFFNVTPVQPFFMPLHAAGPFDFFFASARLHFTTDQAGAVTGFTGIAPDGTPIAGKRLTAGR